MDQNELKEFLTSLKDTDIEEMHYEEGEETVSLKRSNIAAFSAPAVVPVKVAAPKKKEFTPIKSSMVGTFYYSDSPKMPPFVLEGNHVIPGQKVGVIEAMKVMKNANSTEKGKIVDVLVKNGQAVEYGQVLFMVDTEA